MNELGLFAYVNQEKKLDNRMIEMYHAHLDNKTRDRILNNFIHENSKIRILFSTIAFGMGIQIKDVDIVVHWGAPKSLLGHWQEPGRCARDNREGLGVLYPFPRSLVRLKGSDMEKLVKTTEECMRKKVLSSLLLEGMDNSLLNEFGKWDECDHLCESECHCNFCQCCSVCRGKCSCVFKVPDIIQHFLKKQ